jgi:osmoprotectant transport system permease protein
MNGRPLIDWSWVAGHLDLIWTRFLQHLVLVVIPVALGFAISLVIAIVVLRRERAYGVVTAVTGILYTIPSLAAYVLLAQAMGLTLLVAVIPLTAYTLLILVRAIVAGLRSVPADVLEASDGMGLTSRQRLWRVEFPLAVPLMMSGLRLATVTIIGLATVASILGDTFGGFGQFLTEGLQTFFATKIYVGAVLSVLFAVGADLLLVWVERILTPWARARAGAR